MGNNVSFNYRVMIKVMNDHGSVKRGSTFLQENAVSSVVPSRSYHLILILIEKYIVFGIDITFLNYFRRLDRLN